MHSTGKTETIVNFVSVKACPKVRLVKIQNFIRGLSIKSDCTGSILIE